MHTLTQPARIGRVHYAQAGRVMGLCLAVSWLVVGRVAACIATHPAPRPYAHAVSHTVEHVAAPSPVSWRTVAVSSAVSQLCCASCHDTTYCITTHFASQAASGRCRTPLLAIGRAAALPWSCHWRGWTCRGPCCCAHDCCVTIL